MPCIKQADTLDFAGFHAAYEDLIRKVKSNKVTVDDFAGTTVTLTLSQGPRLVRVPNVFSLTEARAVAALEDAGFTVQVDYTFGSAVLGLVLLPFPWLLVPAAAGLVGGSWIATRPEG